ncbi:MAG: hypothetical protein CMJ77_10745 [Planctomycetaceae bacterium]|nr:hypothetical protein [Planctomycetaceae bacterium]
MGDTRSNASFEHTTESQQRRSKFIFQRCTRWAKNLLCLAIILQANSCFGQLFLGHPSVAQEVTPVPLPDPGILEFSFPTPEATLMEWAASNPEAVVKHGRG